MLNSPLNDTMTTGWWFPPLWKILVSWGYYAQYMETYKMFQTTNQIINQASCISYIHFYPHDRDCRNMSRLTSLGMLKSKKMDSKVDITGL